MVFIVNNLRPTAFKLRNMRPRCTQNELACLTNRQTGISTDDMKETKACVNYCKGKHVFALVLNVSSGKDTHLWEQLFCYCICNFSCKLDLFAANHVPRHIKDIIALQSLIDFLS